MKTGRAFQEICLQTDRQTVTQTQTPRHFRHYTPPPPITICFHITVSCSASMLRAPEPIIVWRSALAITPPPLSHFHTSYSRSPDRYSKRATRVEQSVLTTKPTYRPPSWLREGNNRYALQMWSICPHCVGLSVRHHNSRAAAAFASRVPDGMRTLLRVT